jgi:hypothetical protein
MYIFVLTSGTAYEGEDLIGVYSSLEGAQAASESYARRSIEDDRSEGFCAGGDFYTVYRVEVDRAAHWYSDSDTVWCSAS